MTEIQSASERRSNAPVPLLASLRRFAADEFGNVTLSLHKVRGPESDSLELAVESETLRGAVRRATDGQVDSLDLQIRAKRG